MSFALVTGAAKGIGQAIAQELARRGYELLLTDVDEKGLSLSAALINIAFKVKPRVFVVDLSEASAAHQLFTWSIPYHDNLSVVVNNAGYGLNGAFTQRGLSEHLSLINVNVRALVSLSYLFTPVLNRQTQGWLLNVGSTTAYQTVPFLNTYASSKAFVLSFTRGLRRELKSSNVSVSCLSPGSTDTNFVNRAGMSDRTKRIAERYNMTAEQVARIAINGLFNRRAEIIPGFTNKLHAFLPKFFPKALVENIAAKIYNQAVKNDRSTLYTHAEGEDFLTA